MSFNQGWNQAPPRKFRDEYHESRYQSLVRNGTPPGLAQSMTLQLEGATLLSSAGSSRQPEFGRDMDYTSRSGGPPPRQNSSRGMDCSSGSCGPPPRRETTYRPTQRPATPPPAPTSNPFTDPFARNLYEEHVGKGMSPTRCEQLIRENMWADNSVPEGAPPAPNPFNHPTARAMYEQYMGYGGISALRCEQHIRANWPAGIPREEPSSSRASARNPFMHPFMAETYDRFVREGVSPERIRQQMIDTWPSHIPREDFGSRGGGGYSGSSRPATPPRPSTASRPPTSSRPSESPHPSTSSRDRPSGNPYTEPFLRETYDRYIGTGVTPSRVEQAMREDYPAHFTRDGMTSGGRAGSSAGGQTLDGYSGGGGQGGQYQPARDQERRDRAYSQPPLREERRGRADSQRPHRDDRGSQREQYQPAQPTREERGRSSSRFNAPPSQDYTEAEQSMYDNFARLGLQPENAARAVLQQRERTSSASRPALRSGEQSRGTQNGGDQYGGDQHGGAQMNRASSQRRRDDGFGLRGNRRFNPDSDSDSE